MEDLKVVVTGGAGFLGSHFVRQALSEGAAEVVNLDALTYAGDLQRLADVEEDLRYRFMRGDVTDPQTVGELLSQHRPDVVVHYAAESHVTRSESDPEAFRRTNVEGTRVMLEASIDSDVKRFVHISTDEVYGPITQGAYREEDKQPGDLQASPGYAKSKSQADDFALGYSGKIPVVVARPTNAFGPWQFPEKAFPRWITRALRNEPLLVWGDGLYIRQWLFAEDFARAISLLATAGTPGEAYNIGPTHDPEITNLELARWLAGYLGLDEDRVQLTEYDRPHHDRRYAVDAGKIRDLGWQPGDVWEQFARTVDWYRDRSEWWEAHIAEAESIYADS
jgi:dTDP-glucose 4,6-dehydratase